MQGPLGVAKFGAKLGKGACVAVIAIDIPQKTEELFKRGLIDAAVLLEALFGAGFQLIEVPAGLGDADDRQVESLIANQPLQSRENLLVRQIAGCAKKHKCIGMQSRHQFAPGKGTPRSPERVLNPPDDPKWHYACAANGSAVSRVLPDIAHKQKARCIRGLLWILTGSANGNRTRVLRLRISRPNP